MPTFRKYGRLLSLGALAMVVAIVARDGLLDPRSFTPLEGLRTACLVAASVGLLLAWRWEGLGGLLTVAAVGALYAAEHFLAGGLPDGWAYAFLGFPGALFLMDWHQCHAGFLGRRRRLPSH